jgi:hypothetical protein
MEPNVLLSCSITWAERNKIKKKVVRLATSAMTAVHAQGPGQELLFGTPVGYLDTGGHFDAKGIAV